ncbi:hypothetical protein N8I77_002816 [Diaporthe amygdali]|uniref:Heterokaryon incompatibility domain-containing protein n=1 Tax=Phomopsis amygdali TaxID=1214568 RepID=A0AAD9SU29_PHOAM|nr:hypothetical protein N8I77_002816 [Diaporthe amygdali]
MVDIDYPDRRPILEVDHNNEGLIITLPDDWRADSTRDQQDWCPTCSWDGSWDSLLLRSKQRDPALDRLSQASLSASASANRLCCAVLLGLLSRANGGGHQRIQLSDDTDSWVRLDDCEGWGAQTDMGHLFKLFASTSRTPPPGVPTFHLDDPPPVHTSSFRSFAWARDQIEHCSKEHVECRLPEGEPSYFTPSRLIYVPPDPRDPMFLRLRSDIPERIRYAALSYCWGKFESWPLCRTTRENYTSHLDRILPKELPLTLWDAVVATRRLGLEYLWIDSMCIIQDDERDWQVESLQMATVYTHAYVTLFAARAADTRTGMFCERDSGSVSHILTIRYRGDEYPIWAFHVPQESGRIEPRLLADIWRGSLERSSDYPMFNRAWTFQERLASRRVLFFGKEELMMECASGCVFEESMYRLNPPQLSDKTLKGAYADAMNSARKTWWEIVFTYSHLKLTVPTDRLPAIAAVAQRLALHNPTDEYLCGLWRESFLSDLLWERVLNNLGRGDSPIILARWGAESYVAPSWSWASFRSKARNISHILQPLTTVLDVHLDYKDNSKFGRVSGGFAKLRGPVVDLVWHVRAHWNYSQFIDGEQEMSLAGNPDQKITFSVDYDFFSGLNAPSPGWRYRVRCLLIGFDENGSLGALILSRIGQTDCYWRLGILHGSPNSTIRDSIDWREVLDTHSRIETCVIQ